MLDRLAAGASTVMLCFLLAGLEESPGELVIYEGRRFKQYQGIGPLAAMKGPGRDRYASAQGEGLAKLVPEGIEGRVPYKGRLADYVFQMMGGGLLPPIARPRDTHEREIHSQ